MRAVKAAEHPKGCLDGMSAAARHDAMKAWAMVRLEARSGSTAEPSK
jgi:hypothetical protein